MRSIWACSPCFVLLSSAILGRMAAGADPMPFPFPTPVDKQDVMPERLPKVEVTPFPLPHKRDANLCPASYSLCAASANGGCCQDGYACETDSCYLTSPATVTACGKAGYYACDIKAGGGCCPVGYICGRACTPPAGLTITNTACPANYQLCPSSYNYGCCPSGMGCALNACYSTAPFAYTVTSKVTITTDGKTSTAVTTVTATTTPTAPSALPTDDSNYAAKFIPTAIDKVAATEAASNNAGLSSGQIGGIVAGAVAVLLVVLTAAFLVIRHLNRVVDAVESRKEASSAGQTKSQQPPPPQMAYNHHKLHPSPSEVDAFSYDPLIMSNNPSNGSTPQPVSTTGMRNRSDSGSQASTPYNPSSATNDLAAIRHTSMETTGSYFDLPPRISNVPGRHPGSTGVAGQRVSTDSQGTQFTSAYPAHAYQQHGRHYSNTSDAGSSDAGGVGSPLIPAELDQAAGVMGELPVHHDPNGNRSRSSSVASPRASMQTRRRSDPPVSAATPRNDALVGLGFAVAQQQLDVVSEGAEVIHGYYGPRDQAVGQTAAGLDITHDVSSPVNVNQPPQWNPHGQPGPGQPGQPGQQ
ncbi:hypothetical protein GQ53DRAFT_451015 [Thozetella sp. PMI_491]|nr:hypothetical protein GQ53DRAFT_451015 [Thozetella sp. PMI_491]